jgi:hypothetical protein
MRAAITGQETIQAYCDYRPEYGNASAPEAPVWARTGFYILTRRSRKGVFQDEKNV